MGLRCRGRGTSRATGGVRRSPIDRADRAAPATRRIRPRAIATPSVRLCRGRPRALVDHVGSAVGQRLHLLSVLMVGDMIGEANATSVVTERLRTLAAWFAAVL